MSLVKTTIDLLLLLPNLGNYILFMGQSLGLVGLTVYLYLLVDKVIDDFTGFDLILPE